MCGKLENRKVVYYSKVLPKCPYRFVWIYYSFRWGSKMSPLTLIVSNSRRKKKLFIYLYCGMCGKRFGILYCHIANFSARSREERWGHGGNSNRSHKVPSPMRPLDGSSAGLFFEHTRSNHGAILFSVHIPQNMLTRRLAV